jgi:arylsulfatase A-like enzyme
MDLPPTLMEMVGSRVDEFLSLDGKSLYPYMLGKTGVDEVFGEYMGETTITPLYMIRRGQYKYVASLSEPPKSIDADSKSLSLWEQLFDLQEDPSELNNLVLSTDLSHNIVAMKFREEARRKWDFVKIHFDVLATQRQRRVCFKALKKGTFTAWDYEPPQEGANK